MAKLFNSKEYDKFINSNQKGISSQIAALRSVANNKESEELKTIEINNIAQSIIYNHSARHPNTWNDSNTWSQKKTLNGSHEFNESLPFYRSVALNDAYSKLADQPRLIQALEDAAINSTLKAMKEFRYGAQIDSIRVQTGVTMIHDIMPFLEANKDKYKEQHAFAKKMMAVPELKSMFSNMNNKKDAIKSLKEMPRMVAEFDKVTEAHVMRNKPNLQHVSHDFKKISNDKEYYMHSIPLMEDMVKRMDKMKFVDLRELGPSEVKAIEKMQDIVKSYRDNKPNLNTYIKESFSNKDTNELRNRIKFLSDDPTSYFSNKEIITKMNNKNRDLNTNVIDSKSSATIETPTEQKQSLFSRLSVAVAAGITSLRKSIGFDKEKTSVEVSKQQTDTVINESISASDVTIKKETKASNQTPTIVKAAAVEAIIEKQDSIKPIGSINARMVNMNKQIEIFSDMDLLKDKDALNKIRPQMIEIRKWAVEVSKMDTTDVLLAKSLENSKEILRNYSHLVSKRDTENAIMDQVQKMKEDIGDKTKPAMNESDLRMKYNQALLMEKEVNTFSNNHDFVEKDSAKQFKDIKNYLDNNNFLKCGKLNESAFKLNCMDLDDPLFKNTLNAKFNQNGFNNDVHKTMMNAHKSVMDYKRMAPEFKTVEMDNLSKMAENKLIQFNELHKELKVKGKIDVSMSFNMDDLKLLEQKQVIKNRNDNTLKAVV